MIQKLKLFALLTITTTIGVLPARGQDLLARQAPVDRKMKAVDSVALQRLIDFENFENPSADLYDDWDNMHAHSHVTELPDSFRISLKNFCMPTTNRVLTSNFGARWGRQHKGLDIKVYIGDTIRAAFDGKVRVVRYEGRGYGKYVVIRHDNGLETYYAHMSKQLVEEDQEVRAGDPIGLGGNTGICSANPRISVSQPSPTACVASTVSAMELTAMKTLNWQSLPPRLHTSRKIASTR